VLYVTNMASPELEKVLAHLRAHQPQGGARTLADLRRYVDAMGSMEPVAPDIAIEPLTLDGVPAERLAAPGASIDRALLYVHGGAYAFGTLEGYRPLAGRIARAFGAPVFVVAYRLAPEHPFPAGLDDVVKSYRALRATTGGARVAIAGDSAGGGLTLATMLALRDDGAELPAAAACISPCVDLEATGESMVTRASIDPIIQREGVLASAQMYLGSRDRRSPLASPLHADLTGLPPLLVHVGTSETLYDDSVRLVDRAKAHGVDATLDVWEGMIHVFHMFPAFADAHRATARLGAFLREKMG